MPERKGEGAINDEGKTKRSSVQSQLLLITNKTTEDMKKANVEKESINVEQQKKVDSNKENQGNCSLVDTVLVEDDTSVLEGVNLFSDRVSSQNETNPRAKDNTSIQTEAAAPDTNALPVQSQLGRG